MLTFQTGKKPAAPFNPKLGFGAHFAATEAIPTVIPPPDVVDWKMLGNNIAGDCVEAGAAHEVMGWCARAKKDIPLFTPTVVLNDYKAVNPNDPEMKGGTSVIEYSNYRMRIGILDSSGVRHKIVAYAQIEPGNTDQLAQAVERFGCVGVGVALPANATQQFNWYEPWDVPADPKQRWPGKNGHYIVCVGRNSHGHFLFVTWGRLHAATVPWLQTYMDEGFAFIQSEALRPGENIDALKQALQEIAP